MYQEILLIDSHPIYSSQTSRLIATHFDNIVVRTATTLAEAEAVLTNASHISAVVMDSDLSDGTGSESVRSVHSIRSDIPILVLANTNSRDLQEACRLVGARGYLSKQSESVKIIVAIKRMLSNRSYWAFGQSLSELGDLLSNRSAPILINAAPISIAQRSNELTKRQFEVLSYICLGEPNKRIANALGVSESAVKIHASKLFKTLKVKGRMQAAIVAAELGIPTHREPLQPKLKPDGFTLIELLVVVAIIALLASYVGPKFFTQISKSERETARAQIDAFSKALDAYRIDTGHYPNSALGLNALVVRPPNEPKWRGPYLQKAVPVDPWGQPYQFESPGKQGEFDVLSFGKDGKPGGTDDSADLSSWN
jgi:general secretion pathway protein G